MAMEKNDIVLDLVCPVYFYYNASGSQPLKKT